MANVTVAMIGTGPEPDNVVWGESAAMAYRHGEAYRGLSQCDIIGCADIVRENAEAFADEFDIQAEHIFEDYREMLRAVEPDIVSICTPVPTHAELVIGAAETEVPRAIHCEKPMADTWADSKRMAEIAANHDIQLTFNHQRRFSPQWQEAHRLLTDGVIGDLQRIEVGGGNLFDYGSHMVDLSNWFAGERRAEWVLGQVHYEDADVRYGVHNTNQALATWQYDNGIFGFASTGTGEDVISCEIRLVGSAGMIEVNPDGIDTNLRYRNATTGGWKSLETDGVFTIQRAIDHILDCLETDEQPVLSADHALRATEILFAAWESARQRARIDLPLEADGNALTEMVEAGQLDPAREE